MGLTDVQLTEENVLGADELPASAADSEQQERVWRQRIHLEISQSEQLHEGARRRLEEQDWFGEGHGTSGGLESPPTERGHRLQAQPGPRVQKRYMSSIDGWVDGWTGARVERGRT